MEEILFGNNIYQSMFVLKKAKTVLQWDIFPNLDSLVKLKLSHPEEEEEEEAKLILNPTIDCTSMKKNGVGAAAARRSTEEKSI